MSERAELCQSLHAHMLFSMLCRGVTMKIIHVCFARGFISFWREFIHRSIFLGVGYSTNVYSLV